MRSRTDVGSVDGPAILLRASVGRREGLLVGDEGSILDWSIVSGGACSLGSLGNCLNACLDSSSRSALSLFAVALSGTRPFRVAECAFKMMRNCDTNWKSGSSAGLRHNYFESTLLLFTAQGDARKLGPAQTSQKQHQICRNDHVWEAFNYPCDDSTGKVL